MGLTITPTYPNYAIGPNDLSFSMGSPMPVNGVGMAPLGFAPMSEISPSSLRFGSPMAGPAGGPVPYTAPLPLGGMSGPAGGPAPAYSAPAAAGTTSGGMAPAADAAGGGLWSWFGNNAGTLESLAKIGGGLAQIWGGFQANKLARDSFNFEKRNYQTNLANQIKTYNTELEDRIRSRYAGQGLSQAEADAYLAAHKL